MAGDDCLQLDVGNSGAKWRLVKADGSVAARGRYLPEDQGSRAALLNCSESVARIWVASVASPDSDADLSKLLQKRWGIEPWFPSSERQTGDLVNSYSEPNRLGVDRWLAMLAARERCNKRLCVVDAGSALTIDLVAADGRHEGGYIIPGAALMERALLLDTDRVRFSDDVDYSLSPGCSTAEAVRHGIALAQAGALRLVMDGAGQMAGQSDVPQLYFCGGGGQVLRELVAHGGDYAADLVFEGLEVMWAESGGQAHEI